MITLLRLLLAHVVADFLLQTAAMAGHKQSPKWLAAHAGVHAVAYAIVLMPRPAGEVLAVAAALFFVHAAIDFVKATSGSQDAFGFCVDQFAHVVTLVAAASLVPTDPFPAGEVLGSIAASPRWTAYATGYLAVIFGGNYFVQKVAMPFRTKSAFDTAGQYIGWFERFLIVTFVLLRYDAAIAVLLAVKTLARYPELREHERPYADYFIVGTLTSAAVAVAGGVALLYF